MVPAMPFGRQNPNSSLTNVTTKHRQATPSIMFNSSPCPPLKAQLTQRCLFLQNTDWTALGPFLGKKKKHTKPTAYLLQSSVEPKSNSLDNIPHLHSVDITGS